MGEPVKGGGAPGGADRLEALKARVEELGSLNRRLRSARKAAFGARVVVVVVIVLVALGFAYSLISTGMNVWNKRGVMTARIQAAVPRVMTRVQKDVVAMTQRVYPAYLDEAKKQFTEAWPKMQAELKKEGQTLLTNLGDKAEAKINQRIEGLGAKMTAKLRAAFPTLTDEKKQALVLKNLQHGLSSAFVDVMEKRTETGAVWIFRIYDKAMLFLPEQRRMGFEERIQKVWDQLAKATAKPAAE